MPGRIQTARQRWPAVWRRDTRSGRDPYPLASAQTCAPPCLTRRARSGAPATSMADAGLAAAAQRYGAVILFGMAGYVARRAGLLSDPDVTVRVRGRAAPH